MKKLNLFITMLVMIPVIVSAQWSNDPMKNLRISDTVNYNILPKIVIDVDANSYISWFSAAVLNFDVRMQHLDTDGMRLWADNGILISDKTTATWVTDYSMILDHQGNAIVASQDQRTGTSNAYAWSTAPNGDALWTSDGITLSNNTNFNPYPKMVSADNGDMVFCYDDDPEDTTKYTKIILKKVSPDGAPLWGDGVILEYDTLNYWFSRISLASDGNIIISFLSTPNRGDLPFGAQVMDKVMTQKIDMEGNFLWTDPIRVDTGKLLEYPGMYVVPYITPDEYGGAYVCWFTGLIPVAYTTSIYIQRVKSDGTLAFAEGPANVSLNYDHDRWEPAICTLPGDTNLYVYWTEYFLDGTVDQFGMGGQKITPSGQRMWGDNGKVFIPLEDWTNYWGTIPRPGLANDMIVFYFKQFWEIDPPDTLTVDEMYAMRINTDGEFVWENEKVLVAGSESQKDYHDASGIINDQWIAVWSDTKHGGSDTSVVAIYAQNIGLDGSLGPLYTPETLEIKKSIVSVYPNPFRSEVTFGIDNISGGNVELSIYDVQGRLVSVVINNYLPSGKHVYTWNPVSHSSGLYYYKLTTTEGINSGKLIRY